MGRTVRGQQGDQDDDLQVGKGSSTRWPWRAQPPVLPVHPDPSFVELVLLERLAACILRPFDDEVVLGGVSKKNFRWLHRRAPIVKSMCDGPTLN
jgi:hypothetical protein